jgi:hypothetical protein
MTESDMRQAGELADAIVYTNEELALAIKGARFALAYITGLGRGWQLARTPLIIKLDQLESAQESRKRPK